MGNGLRMIALVSAVGFIWGCSSVRVATPIGKPVDDEGLSKEANGIWAISNESAYHVHHLGDGTLHVAMVEWNEKTGAFEFGQGKAALTQIGEDRYFQIQDIEQVKADGKSEEAEREYLLLKALGPDDGMMIVHAPKSAKFAEHVRDKTIAGTAKKPSDVRVAKDGVTALEEVIRSAPAHELFELEKPLVLRRVFKKK